MIAYPAQLDPEALPMLLNAFRGQIPDPHKVVHLAYDTLGYGLSKVYPDTAALTAMLATRQHPADFNAAALAIESHLNALQAKGAAPQSMAANEAVGTLPWSIILPALLKLIVTILGIAA